MTELKKSEIELEQAHRQLVNSLEIRFQEVKEQLKATTAALESLQDESVIAIRSH